MLCFSFLFNAKEAFDRLASLLTRCLCKNFKTLAAQQSEIKCPLHEKWDCKYILLIRYNQFQYQHHRLWYASCSLGSHLLIYILLSLVVIQLAADWPDLGFKVERRKGNKVTLLVTICNPCLLIQVLGVMVVVDKGECSRQQSSGFCSYGFLVHFGGSWTLAPFHALSPSTAREQWQGQDLLLTSFL